MDYQKKSSQSTVKQQDKQPINILCFSQKMFNKSKYEEILIYFFLFIRNYSSSFFVAKMTS